VGASDELAEQLAVAASELGVEVTLRRAESDLL
jgi:glycine cleavage system transcriptional repressor